MKCTELVEDILDDIASEFDYDSDDETPSFKSAPKNLTGGIFYHGTNSNFGDFKIGTDKANRGTNVTGIYFTPSEEEAEDYGERIITARLTWTNPFYYGRKNDINDAMIAKARELLLKYTAYRENYLDDVILPEFKKAGDLSKFSDIDGDIKREILLAGGYDVYMDGMHVVMLNTNNIKVIK